jgi:hypothetical protein
MPVRSQPELQKYLLDLLHRRGPGKSICPSEVARSVAPEDWRPLMESVRTAARELARAGRIRITQGDAELDPDGDWSGPVRLRLPRS